MDPKKREQVVAQILSSKEGVRMQQANWGIQDLVNLILMILNMLNPPAAAAAGEAHGQQFAKQEAAK